MENMPLLENKVTNSASGEVEAQISMLLDT